MNTQSSFPCRFNWTSQDVADAVPLRLFEMISFEAVAGDTGGHIGANRPIPRRGQREGYLPAFRTSSLFHARF